MCVICGWSGFIILVIMSKGFMSGDTNLFPKRTNKAGEVTLSVAGHWWYNWYRRPHHQAPVASWLGNHGNNAVAKQKCAEGQRQFRLVDGLLRGRGVARDNVPEETAMLALLSCGVWEALMSLSLWFSGATWCTYSPHHSHPYAFNVSLPLHLLGSRTRQPETSYTVRVMSWNQSNLNLKVSSVTLR